jgi:hypothetical protein
MSAINGVEKRIENLSVGEATTFQNKSVFPVFNETEFERGYINIFGMT